MIYLLHLKKTTFGDLLSLDTKKLKAITTPHIIDAMENYQDSGFTFRKLFSMKTEQITALTSKAVEFITCCYRNNDQLDFDIFSNMSGKDLKILFKEEVINVLNERVEMLTKNSLLEIAEKLGKEVYTNKTGNDDKIIIDKAKIVKKYSKNLEIKSKKLPSKSIKIKNIVEGVINPDTLDMFMKNYVPSYSHPIAKYSYVEQEKKRKSKISKLFK